jgi:hypothetical protein
MVTEPKLRKEEFGRPAVEQEAVRHSFSAEGFRSSLPHTAGERGVFCASKRAPRLADFLSNACVLPSRWA